MNHENLAAPWTLRRDGHFGDCHCSQSDFPLWVQSRLARFVPSSVPQNGFIDRVTRRAIRMFQSHNQLPPTGLLDHATIEALHTGGPYPPTDQDDLFGLLSGRHEEAGEREFEVRNSCSVTVTWSTPVAIPLATHWDESVLRAMNLPLKPGLYIIYVGAKPWYVGISTDTIYNRWLRRIKVLRDLNVPSTALANRSVSWWTLGSHIPSCTVFKGPKGGPYKTQLSDKDGILSILEQHYIKVLATDQKGNVDKDQVFWRPGQNFVVNDSDHPSGYTNAHSFHTPILWP